jgi:hypothetical protein
MEGSGFRDFVREKNYYSWYFQALNIYVKAVLFPWEKKNIIRMTV